jgi:hypothetical protein
VKTFRRVCLWLHREIGFLAVGLTLVYAISGLAVNHAHHWNPNYTQSRELSQMEPVGAGPTTEITPLVLERLALPEDEAVKNTWRSAPDKLQVFVDGATYTVNLEDGEIRRDGVGRRAALYEMNFMHLNTGKGVWTGVADAFAGVMILLAITGIFLVRGAKGLKGRGGVLMVIGILLPLIYALSSEVF